MSVSATATVPAKRRVRTPVRLQMEATECGAAALGIVLAHYGRWVDLEQLRDDCGISRDGSNALSVKRAAQKHGMTVTARRCEPDDLRHHDLPAIVFWRFQHFLVVEGWSGDQWYLNDPQMGHRTCSSEEFTQSFTGVALTMTPGPDFRSGGHRPRVMSRLAHYLVGSRDGVLLMGILGLLLIIPQILVPGLARLFVDWLNGGPAVKLPNLLAAMALAACLQAALVGLQGAIGMRLATKVSIILQSRMVARLLLLPAGFHALRGAGSLAQRAAQPANVAQTVSAMFSSLAVGLISSLTAILLLLLTYPPAGFVAIVATACTVGSLYAASRRRRVLAMRMVREQSDVAAVSVGALAQIEVIKAAGAEDHATTRWSGAHDRYLGAAQQLGERGVLPGLLPVLMITLGNAAVTIVGLIGVTDGRLSLGGFVAVLTLLGMALAPAAGIVGQVQQAETLVGELDQIDDILNTEIPPAAPPDDLRPAVMTGEVRITGVTFGYDPARPALLHDVDLHITPGARVALVGPSGCGKSTVARLLAGLYEPWEGEILLDGHPRAWWPAAVLHHHIGVVDQEPTIFAGSFRDNITLWDPTIGEAEIITAAMDAGLHDDIARRPGSYDAVLRETGADLSGGQRQRLAIARALVRNPPLLIMDEATSALDAATEAHIDAAIRRRGLSCLIVAHRLSTVRDADEILVLAQGRIVERGTHADLLDQAGTYRQLVTA